MLTQDKCNKHIRSTKDFIMQRNTAWAEPRKFSEGVVLKQDRKAVFS